MLNENIFRSFKQTAIKILWVTSLCFISLSGFSNTLTGYWQTVSDQTHHVASIVKIWSSTQKQNTSAKQYFGKIVKIYEVDGAKKTDLCKNCSGKFHNKPILNMPVIFNMSRDGVNYFTGGKILDPKSGHVYSCNMRLSKTGKQLIVRGYIGFSLLGRSQTWYRVKSLAGKEHQWTRA